jgi:uridine kinase
MKATFHPEARMPYRMENEVAIDLITEHIKMKLQQPELKRLYHNLEVMPSNFQIRGMHTLIRDCTTSKADFVFYADRLLRLVRIAFIEVTRL